VIDVVKKKFGLLLPTLNERTKRLFAAAEAQAIGHGGITIVSHATGLERHTIARGIKELYSDKNYLLNEFEDLVLVVKKQS
jgi:RNase P protein component